MMMISDRRSTNADIISTTTAIIQPLIFIILLNLAVGSALPGGGIRVRDETPFRIAVFADLHFGENSWTHWGPPQDVKSCGVYTRHRATRCNKLSYIVPNCLSRKNKASATQPHLLPMLDFDISTLLLINFVIYLGDVITANNVMTKNATLYWDLAVSPTRTRGIPWSSIFGNHDDAPFEWPLEWFSETGIPRLNCSAISSFTGGDECSFRRTTRLELMKSETSENSLSYSKTGPESLWPNVSNYVIKLLSSSDSKEVIALLYFFDSGGGSYPKVISNAQVKWFQQKSEEVNPDSRVPEIIFWHIPSKAFKVVAPEQDRCNRCVGSMFSEDVAPQEAEMGIMKVLEERTSVKGIFVGHNHGLDWCCPYKQLWLCFARHTGYGGYGNWSRGARILEINHEPFTLKSWIRMEDGHVHSELTLSS